MRVIKLMTDYHCSPLWEQPPGDVGNVDPETLPLSKSLKERLASWARAYDASLNMEDPASSGFKTAKEENEFNQTGKELAAQLQTELGKKFTVKY